MTEAPIKRSVQEWDDFFYAMAEKVAELSKDPDRQVGAVLVSPDRRQMSLGYNGFPPEIQDLPSLLADKEFKLANMQHAEHNCLLQAPFSAVGCTLYVTRFPCYQCALRVVESGVARVVAPRLDPHSKWYASWYRAYWLMWMIGVKVTFRQDDGLQT